MTTTQTQSVEQVKQEILSDLRTRCWENAEQVDAYFETALDRMAEAVVAQERDRIWHEHLGLGKPIREVLSNKKK